MPLSQQLVFTIGRPRLRHPSVFGGNIGRRGEYLSVTRSIDKSEAESSSCGDGCRDEEDEEETVDDEVEQGEDDDLLTSVAPERWDVLGLGQAMVCFDPFQDFTFSIPECDYSLKPFVFLNKNEER